MSPQDNAPIAGALRGIRTTIAGLALAVITAGLTLHNEPLAFPALVLTLVVLAYSFVPTLRNP